MSTQHTATPYEVRTGKSAHAAIYVSGTNHNIAVGVKPADAAFIVRACNSHDELLAALQATLPALIRLGDFIGNVDNADVHPRGTGIDRCKLIEQVRAAIAKIVAHSVTEVQVMNCDQCEALMINGVFCHETGCPNSGKRWDGETWVEQRECFTCGCTVDADDVCCCE